MVGFVIPFRPKSSSSNWAHHSALVTRTIKSICNQTDKNFKVIVSYTDLPEELIQHPSVIYLHFPLTFLQAKDITDFESYGKKYYIEVNAQNAMDQARRSMYACKHAIELGCDYVMSVDDDDLVSNKIASFVNGRIGEPGWFVNKGYVYIEGNKSIYRHVKNLNHFCGSTHIVRADLISMPDFKTRNLLDYNFFSSHTWLSRRLKDEKQVEIQPLPFYGIVYILHPASWTNNAAKYEQTGLRKFLKFLFLGQLITKSIRKEFCLYKLTK